MKKGMVYIEALISSIISIVLIVSISKLTFTASKILNDTREKGKAIDIIRGVGSLYRGEKMINTNINGVNLSEFSDIYSYIEKGLTLDKEENFKLYTENVYDEGLEIIKIKITSNKNRFKDISVVIAK